MPIIINRSQPVIAAGTYPRSVYSRIVSVALGLDDDGKWYHVLSNAIGNNFWLLNVDAWLAPKAINLAQATLFDIYVGTGTPATALGVREWDGVVPIFDDANVRYPWIASDGSEHFHWTMSRFFKGGSRRFAVAGMRPLGQGDDYLKVSFEICEG